jgi:lysosomal-associated membrane protein 1/2
MLRYFALLALIALVSAQNTTTTEVNVSTNSTVGTSTHSETTMSTNSTTTLIPSSTTSTSTVSTTTPTAKPTPSTSPKPPPSVPTPAVFSGNVTENKTTCIMFEFGVKVTFKYNTTNGLKLTGFVFSLNSTVDKTLSHCNDSSERLFIKSPETETSANLSLVFNKVKSDVSVSDLDLSFLSNDELMPGSKLANGTVITGNKRNLTLFKVAEEHSYLCSAVQSGNLDSDNNDIIDIQIEFVDSKVEAYSKSEKFDSPIDCKSADISDVVPIAVGAALAGLVIIVLIAYFIGRRRSRRLAYQSV